jgi:hypothetical protein
MDAVNERMKRCAYSFGVTSRRRSSAGDTFRSGDPDARQVGAKGA